MKTTPNSHDSPVVSKRPTLGVCAISYNEEKDLPYFLEHLVSWVDEIVIIDDGSTDRTAEIASSFHPKVNFMVSPRKPGEYYSHQRNKAIRVAKSDWLLHMDIDERVTPGLAQEILEAIRDPQKDAYRYRRLNFFLHRPVYGSGWQRWNQIHLARRERFKFGGKMHETCLTDAPKERIGQLKGKMWHLNDDSWEERLEKNIVYAKVEAENICEKNIKIEWYHFIIYPIWRGFKAYFWDGGFRDGTIGSLMAMYTITGTFNWYAFAWDRQNRISRESLEEKIKNL
jgi:(heptosyl)LPS beta-1,4-glucosyltransferase